MRRALLVLGVAALVGCASGESGDRATSTPPIRSAPFADLERAPVLDELGVADLETADASVVFMSGFETLADFGGSYVTPQSDMTRHELSGERVHGGASAHHGWLTGVGPSTPEVDGPNHRGYPTVQLWKRPIGAVPTPCVVDLWLWLDATLDEPGDWFSLATFSTSPPDDWGRVITVNVGYEGWLHTFHVPNHGEGVREYQTEKPFPLREWVRVTTYLDFRADGVIAVWQDGQLASVAGVVGGSGDLVEAHFGLYAPPGLTAGSVFNDDLTISCLERGGGGGPRR